MFKISIKSLTILAVFMGASIQNATAADLEIGDLTISQPTLRATPPGSKVGAGYLSITNNGATAETLVGGTAKFSAKTEVHEMKMTDSEMSVMKMQKLENGLIIPAGETVSLAPGGNHLMFMGLKQNLTAGEKQTVELSFQNSGDVDVVFDIKSIAETLKLRDKAKMTHKMHKMAKDKKANE